MTDEAPTVAQRMFPNMPGDAKPADTPTDTSTEKDERSTAEKMFGPKSDDNKAGGRDLHAEAKENAEKSDRMTDSERAEAAETLGKELSEAEYDVSSESAKSFLDFAAEKKLTKDDAAQLAELADKRGAEQWDALSEQWTKETKALPNFESTLADGVEVVREFDEDGKLADLLDWSRMGSHPVVVSFLGRVGAALKKGGQS